jgi:hypothetical protein
MKTRLNGILKRCAILLQQHYYNIDYTPNEEMSAFRIIYKQFYNLLELELSIDLDYRLEQIHIQLRADGINKSKLQKVTRMNIIEQDEELHESALELSTQLLRRYEKQVFAININLSEVENMEEL